MNYIEYLTTDAKCWFDTGIIPDFTTKIEVSLIPLDWSSLDIPEKSWNGFVGAQNSDDVASTFQIRNYDHSERWSARVGNGNGNVGPNYTRGTQYTLTLDADNFNVDGTNYATGAGSMDTCNYTLFISAINNGETSDSWSLRRAAAATFYYLKVWKNDVLVGDFRPVNNNGSIGFYDEVSQTFRANLGTGTPVAGPSLSSIVATASKTTLKNTGETINIVVDTENAWTLSTSGDSFLTFSSTGDTSGATITATAPSYSGTTARETTITFTDSVTNDTAVITIKQKKYISGQPVYLGGNEVTELYLGGNSVSEAYLGENLVYSSGPFVGLKLIPKSISFNSDALTGSCKVKSSEPWSMTVPAWTTASTLTGDTGETIVTLTATTQTAATSGTIVVTSANYSASVYTSYDVFTPVSYIHSENMGDSTQLYITLPVNCGTNSIVRITGKGAGYNTGGFIIGNGLSGSNGDWRWFGINNRIYLDINQDRLERSVTYSPFDSTKKEFDFTLANHYWAAEYDGQSYTASGNRQTNVSPRQFILVLSVLWISSIEIYDYDTLVFNGTAGRVGDKYGLLDSVSGDFITSTDFTIVGEE